MWKVVILFLLMLTNVNAQIVDTVINTGFYKSYYDKDIKEPICVVYKLFKAGGNCSRAGFRFKNDTQIPTATDKDYAGSGFDMGHLANAADFAFDCKKDEMTFRFYNCLPQYPNLNRDIWKKGETQIRLESQSDSLLVVCGGFFSTADKKIGSNVQVPTYCWKVVMSLTTKKIMHVWWYYNVNKDADKYFKEITITELEKQISWKIPLEY
jgi:endonuclease G